nr:ATP-binding protein [Micromonospora sp. DSM 115978]
MGVALYRSIRAGHDPTALASLGMHRTLVLLMVVVRLSSGVVGTLVAFCMPAPGRAGLTALASVGALLWAIVFAYRTMRHGPSEALIWVDILVVALLLMAHPWLVPEQVRAASAGTGWIDLIAGAGVLIAQVGLRQPLGLAAGLLVAVTYAVGDGQVREAPVHLAVEAMLGAGLVTLLRRAADSADSALAAEATGRAEAVVRAAVRSDERRQQRQLHDTALATLTMVHTGGVATGSAALLARATADLATIESLRDEPTGGHGWGAARVRLDIELRSLAARPPTDGCAPLDLRVDAGPVDLPAEVAAAISDCVTEALSNVVRHSGTGEARLAAHAKGDGVIVTVSDDGRGFDPSAVPTHRRGLRESIAGRMSAIGGSARVQSSVGTGTEVTLRWPDVG